MKNKIIIIITLLFLVINVKADLIKGDTRYYITEDLYCGETRVYLFKYIEKSGKLLVYDTNNSDDMYIWSEGNVCTKATHQDILDSYNSPISSYNDLNVENSYSKNYTYSDVTYYYSLVKANTFEIYDANREYYTMRNKPYVVHESSEENFDNYYVYVYLKYIDSVDLDPNKVYYAYSDMYRYEQIDYNDINDDNIEFIMVQTTPEEINLKNVIYTMDEEVLNNLITDSWYHEFVYFVDRIIFSVNYNDETYKYFEMDGTEITELRNKYFKSSSYYVSIIDVESALEEGEPRLLEIYDSKFENLIFSKKFTGDDQFYDATLYDTGGFITYFDGVKIRESNIYFVYYKLVEGNNQTFNGDSNITIKFSGAMEAFKELKLNGEVVDSSNYNVTKGSTIITLNKAYLNTLDNGDYELSAVYIDGGYANVNLSINKTDNPPTSDNIYINILLTIISFMGIIILPRKLEVK